MFLKKWSMETFRQSGQKVHIGISDIQGLKAFELMEKLRKTFGQTTNKDNLCRGIGSGDILTISGPIN